MSKQEKQKEEKKAGKTPFRVLHFPAKVWEKVKPKIRYDEYRGVWRTVGITCGVLVALTIGTVTYYSYNTPMDRDTSAGTQEMDKATDELSDEISKEVGFEFPTKEEVEQHLTKLEKRNGDLLPMGRYNAVKEEYGEKVADCYVSGLLVSIGMSDEDKDQVVRSVRDLYGGKVTQGAPKRDVYNRPQGQILSKGRDSGAIATDYWADTGGFDKVGDWFVGYPVVAPNGFETILDTKETEKEKDKFKDKTLIHFYAFTNEDKEVEDVVKELSELEVTLNGKKAKTPSSVSKNYGLPADMDLGAVTSLIPAKGKDIAGTKLLKGGLVEVVYVIDNAVLFTDPAELDTDEVKKAHLKVNGKSYDIFRNPKEFKEAPIMNYTVRGDA
ncbi:hypothetical protein [Bacillus cereus]|uniref:hypothetical protein n=1 Tax=Bacillus cereus TaxID=1396 RepID=UPI000BFD0013|nr:hypothetical protein [Bacillus cereus]PGR83642.1 hypothetical protein COC63_06550 [Bacillus cereus]